MLQSMVCKYEDFGKAWYRAQERALSIRQIYAGHSAGSHDFVNRKFWEWCAISQALQERNVLTAGSRGLGFAVGTEPLASFFASRDCTVLATDLDAAMSDPAWINSGQHAASLSSLHQPKLVDQLVFERRVSFQPADMRSLEGLPTGYDFIWSSCALEHLGTIDQGIDFILNSARLLRPNGVAAHTTEFNVLSNDRTIEAGPNVIYRRQDIVRLSNLLAASGFELVAPDFDAGEHPFDLEFDRPPYMESERRHIRLLIDGHVSTSMLLVLQRLNY